MGWNGWVRRIHRWTSILFTLIVVLLTGVTLRGGEEPSEWLYFLPLPFLGILLLSGLYLFALPYLGRARRRGIVDTDTGSWPI